ncbi:MAG: zinc ribbon domain-containing protein [Syntrophobacteraceae bacterium]
MPIYEFRCAGCGHIQEFIVSSGGQLEIKCSECNGEHMERVLSRTNFAFGSSGSEQTSGPSSTTRTCGPGKSCTSITLPGYTKP